MRKIKIGDLFAGIGGFHQATKELTKTTCEIACEIDKNAVLTYVHNHKFKLFFNDIKDIKEIPKLDILFGGFPCQAFSIAGYRKGFSDKRGFVTFNLIDIINYNKPKVIFLENVKNLVSHEKGKTFNKILCLLKPNYSLNWKILNSKDFGVPQNRERVYIVGFKKGIKNNFNFPNGEVQNYTIKDWLFSKKVDNKYYYEDKPIMEKLKQYEFKENQAYQWRQTYIRENKSSVFPTFTANMGTGGHNVPIVLDNYGLRKLTPEECLKIQGYRNFKFPFIADCHKYKQIGNSITIPVVKAIIERILNVLV